MAVYARCAADPILFLSRFARIKSTARGEIPFDLYPYQRMALMDLVANKLNIVLKNRQVGWTWLVAGYAIFKAIFNNSQNIIIVSKSEEAAGEVLDYCRFIHNSLPPWMRPDIDRNRMTAMSFPSNNSRIRALSASVSSGIGFGAASLVILDEFDFHPYAEENYIEIKPMIDAGGQLIILSAPNRLKLRSPFKELWVNARKGNNNFHPILTTFGAVPHHTDEWFENVKKEYPLGEIETRYFKTEEEALSVTSAGKFFPVDKLQMMATRALSPLEVEDPPLGRDILTIYKPPVRSFRYAVFTDPSSGNVDPFHTVVVDIDSKEEVANAHGYLSADECAYVHSVLVKYYNDAANSYEYNGYSGGRFQSALEGLHVQNQMYSRLVDGTEHIDRFGYWSSPQLKTQLLGNMREHIVAMEYIIHDMATLDEMALMLQEYSDKGVAMMPAVPKGEHDDRVMAWAGVMDLVNRAPKGEMIFRTFVPSRKGGYALR